MLTIKNFEMTELYSAPSCKVVLTTINHDIMAVSSGEGGFEVDDLTEENL